MRMLSRMGCLVHQQLVTPTKRFPHRLLKVCLNPEEEAPKVLATRECIYDQFTHDFLAAYPAEQLSSPDAVHTLQTICHCQPTDTVQIEESHGRVSRLLKSQSVQTHNLSLPFLNAQQVCFKHRARESNITTALAARADPARATPQLPQQPSASGKRQVAKRKKGGGGTWRALISHLTKGQKGKADFSALAQKYKELKQQPTEEFASIVSQGEAATKYHKLTGGSGFGPPTRQARRRRIAALPSLPGPSGTLLPATYSLLPSSSQSASTSPWSLPISVQLTEVRRQVKATKQPQKTKELEDLGVLKRFAEEAQPSLMEELLNSFQGSLPMVQGLHIAPNTSFLACDVVFNPGREGEKVASWAWKHAQTCNLRSTLSNDWDRQQQSKQHDAQAALPEDLPVPTLCSQHGLCLCTGIGRQVFALRNAFLKAQKACLQRADVTRKGLLMDGFVVAQLIKGPSVETKPKSSWGSRIGQVPGHGLEAGAMQTREQFQTDVVWVHIGLQYLKPYRPTFQVLEVHQELPAQRTQLQQTGFFCTDTELFYHIPLDHQWSVHFHTMVSTVAPLGSLEPRFCVVERLTPEPVPLATSRKRGPRGPRRGSARAVRAKQPQDWLNMLLRALRQLKAQSRLAQPLPRPLLRKPAATQSQTKPRLTSMKRLQATMTSCAGLMSKCSHWSTVQGEQEEVAWSSSSKTRKRWKP